MRARRPQSATLIEEAKARRADRAQQQLEKRQLCVVGAGRQPRPPLWRRPVSREVHKPISPGSDSSTHFGVVVDDEWNQLGVLDVDSDDSDDDSPDMTRMVQKALRRTPSPQYRGHHKHQVSPVSSTARLHWPPP